MKSDNHDEIRRRLSSVPAAQPPADLAARIKAEIPQELRVIEEPAGSRSDRAALWRLAASVLMIFGFAYVAARTYLESRVAERTALSRVPAAASAPAEEARSASNETVAAPEPEMKREMEHDDLLKLTQPPAAPPFAPEVQRQAKTAARRERDTPADASAPAMTAEAEKPAAFESVEEVSVSESLTVTASAPKIEQAAAQSARSESRDAMKPEVAAGAAAPAPPPPASPRNLAYASSAPRLISRVYPERETARKDLQGTTLTFVVTVGADGRVKTVKPITRLSRRDAAEWVDAIRRWTFEPARRGGEAVEATTRVVIDPAVPVTPEQ